jgi:hypothetical protein
MGADPTIAPTGTVGWRHVLSVAEGENKSVPFFAGIVEYTTLPYNKIVEFIEATAFTKYVYDYLSDDEYLGLQSFLLQYPESGKVAPGSGGVRKIR